MIGKQTILTVDKKIKEDLQREIIDQGHHLTGALEESIKSTVEISGDVALDIEANDYLNPLNTGVPASRIPFNSSQRNGGTSKYIQGLIRYAQLRMGKEGKEAVSIAFAIAKTHEKTGMPTPGSYAYSKTGQRKNLIPETLEKNDYDKQIENGLSEEIDSAFNFPDLTVF